MSGATSDGKYKYEGAQYETNEPIIRNAISMFWWAISQ